MTVDGAHLCYLDPFRSDFLSTVEKWVRCPRAGRTLAVDAEDLPGVLDGPAGEAGASEAARSNHPPPQFADVPAAVPLTPLALRASIALSSSISFQIASYFST